MGIVNYRAAGAVKYAASAALLAIVLVLAAPELGRAAPPVTDFTVELPAGTSVIMGNTSATLNFLVFNSASSAKNIRAVEFAFDSNLYYIDEATNPPAGWEIKSRTDNTICIARATGGIAAGGSEEFPLVLTGPSSGTIVADASDQTDTLDIANVTAKDADVCGNQFTLISSPSWTRKGIEAQLVASPESLGTGSNITLTMQVTNRSTVTQNTIIPTATFDPPDAMLYATATLTSTVLSADTTLNVSSTSGFTTNTTTHTLKLSEEDVTCPVAGVTATTFTGCTRGANSTSATYHFNGETVYHATAADTVSDNLVSSSVTGPSPTSLDLNTGESNLFTWTYTTTGVGSVHFGGSAGNGTVTSAYVFSDQVVIGDFTASVSQSPLAVISGQTTTVTLIVSNNGDDTQGDITPSLTTGGTATSTCGSSSPANVVTLTKDQSTTFTWTCTITGTAGDTYFYTASATAASSGDTTNTAVSESGSITSYSATISPESTTSGTTNLTIDWTVYNNGGEEVKKVTVPIPAGWTYSSATSSGWSVAWDGTNVEFSAGTNIAIGGSRDISITFSLVPTVSSDTAYTFPIIFTDKKNNTASVDTSILVTAYIMLLTYEVTDTGHANYPEGPIDADGLSTYTLSANLTKSGVAVAGVLIDFYADAGTFSIVGPTDVNGEVTVYLTSPCSNADISDVTINATYLNAEDPQQINPSIPADKTSTGLVAYSATAVGNIIYVGGSFTDTIGSTTPPDVATGDNVTLEITIKNCGQGELTISSTYAELTFDADTFILDLPNSIGSINKTSVISNETAVFTFQNGNVASSAVRCAPDLVVSGITNTSDGSAYTGSYSTAEPITDYITIDSATECVAPTVSVDVFDWFELL